MSDSTLLPESSLGLTVTIDGGQAQAYTIPADAPEADGTFAWRDTTLVLVTLSAAGTQGLGYTYSHKAAAVLAQDLIDQVVLRSNAFDTRAVYERIRRQQRNYGTQGIAATALSAIDIALWDLKAKLLGLPLCKLLGMAHFSTPVYGSGGFTTYSDEQMTDQLRGWVSQGIPRVKIKVGSAPDQDPHRVRVARAAIGPHASLFVDANGAYTATQALALGEQFARESNVTWFEEPVSSDDLHSLARLRAELPAPVEVAAGEYGWDTAYFARMLETEAVDVLQADATRCGGVTGFLEAASLAAVRHTPFSAHCGPSLHRHLCLAASTLRHLEYFHDHVRIERMLFDGVAVPKDGCLYPDLAAPGLGLVLKEQDAVAYRVRL